MLTLAQVAETSRDVAATPSRTAKIGRLARLLRGADPAQAAIATSWLTGVLPQGRIGIGPAVVRAALAAAAEAADTAVEDGPAEPLTVGEVDVAFQDLRAVAGAGSTAARRRLLTRLFRRAHLDEREFLARLLWGELRQGALDGVMADAVASAAGLPVADVRRAAQLAGDLPSVAHAALAGGADALRRFSVRLFRPLQPMLAQPATDMADALQRLGRAALDYKLDGARVQVHRSADEVRVYTRRLNEVTAAVPEIVEATLALPVRDVVLDGEAIALREDGTPEPFQVTMSRFGSRVDVQRLRASVPLAVLFFDCLYVDGESLLDAPAAQRFATMERLLPPHLIVRRTVTGDAAEAGAFLAAARGAGHEGVVVKALESPYEAGRRGGAWLKVKQADTLDLVVLAAEWGSGRRRGWLSNLHLGARDEAGGGWIMLGKTFKGLTDALLEWQTRELLARETGREGHIVYVRPELVVEIAFEGVQASPRYPGGVALRFARVKRYRDDKGAAEADTIERVLALHRGSS
jgi:DNA ligase 1